MRKLIAPATACRHIVVAAIVGATLTLASPIAVAQSVIVIVNGDPVTTLDLEQRIRFHQLASNNTKVPSRPEVVQELIDEKIKVQLPRRFDFSGHNLDGDVENALGNMARRQLKTAQQFSQELNGFGVLGTLKSRLKAEIIWTQIVRGKFQSSQPNDNEILKELESRNKEDQGGNDYTVRPILFLAPKGSSQAVIDTKRREAEALRQRFQSCEQGVPFARALPQVIVREPVVRSSADLPPAQREILEKTEVGKLTPPEVTMQGIELYALCGKKPSSKDNTIGKREVREEIYSKRLQANAKKFLKELRDQSYCNTPDGRMIKGCLATELVSSK
jgi:peptidyl-prolyl cis-trans isomerase SurA